MRLVDDDRKASVFVLRTDVIEDKRELLNRGDDDLLAVGDEAAKIAGMLGMPDGCANLGELLDGIAD